MDTLNLYMTSEMCYAQPREEEKDAIYFTCIIDFHT